MKIRNIKQVKDHVRDMSMKRLFRRNQIIITTLAVMIAAAGYLNYAGKRDLAAGSGVYEAGAMDISDADILAENQAAEDKFTTYFQSANVRGAASEVTEDQEKILALRALCEKLTPSNMAGDNFDRAIAKSLARTGVWRIQIQEAVGKENCRRSPQHGC